MTCYRHNCLQSLAVACAFEILCVNLIRVVFLPIKLTLKVARTPADTRFVCDSWLFRVRRKVTLSKPLRSVWNMIESCEALTEFICSFRIEVGLLGGKKEVPGGNNAGGIGYYSGRVYWDHIVTD